MDPAKGEKPRLRGEDDGEGTLCEETGNEEKEKEEEKEEEEEEENKIMPTAVGAEGAGAEPIFTLSPSTSLVIMSIPVTPFKQLRMAKALINFHNLVKGMIHAHRCQYTWRLFKRSMMLVFSSYLKVKLI